MTERPTYPKSTCCIRGCPRWSRKFPGEWMCGRHWRAIPPRCRRAFNKTRAQLNDLYSIWQGRTNWTAETSAQWGKADRRLERLWAHARRLVILREAGLT